MQELPPSDPAFISVCEWMAAWGDEVAAADLTAGRARFHSEVVAFGTHADVVHGIDALQDQQWGRVWPAIADFAFRLEDLVVLASPDRLQAVVVVGWSSTGFAVDGQPYDRPGRATVVLCRDDEASRWMGAHTHFSLARGVPESTYGRT
ncbi:nuclear transport factor 2 family protein [soil metagenome]